MTSDQQAQTECLRITFSGISIQDKNEKKLLKQRFMIGSNKRKHYHNKQPRFQEELKTDSPKTSLFRVDSAKTLLYSLVFLNTTWISKRCSIISDIFADPKQLPCLHSFCLHCLKQWHRTSHGCGTIRCPKCQAVSRLPESGDLKDLPTSFYLNGLIGGLSNTPAL